MGLAHLFGYARTLRPAAAAALGWRRAGRLLAAHAGQAGDYFRDTFPPADGAGAPPFHALAPELPLSLLAAHAGSVALLSRHCLEHRFDLLGSGRLRVARGMACKGIAGHSYPPQPAEGDPSGLLSPGNRARARSLRATIAKGYRPIDWQIDFKSGYRWSEGRASKTLLYGHEPGADIKVPWELARLQHLPQLAWAHRLAGSGQAGFAAPQTYRDEFKNQILDFISANPPRYGVNWMATMEVAIRAANMVLAMDQLRSNAGQFDNAFLAEFAAAVRAHGKHIAANLEWRDGVRGNHYLANVAGLSFIAAYLPGTAETDGWLAFAVRQLVDEVARQFTPDGANFEASTNYHRLSAEMAVYATALVVGLAGDKLAALATAAVEMHPLPGGDGLSPFPAWYFERLERMAEFTQHATKPNRRVVQIGDTDDGRLFKLFPRLEDDGGGEDALDHRGLAAAVSGLMARPDLAAFAGPEGKAEAAFVRGLAGGRQVASYLQGGAAPAALERRIEAGPGDEAAKEEREDVRELEIIIELPDPAALDGLQTAAYPDFGLYLWRAERFFLSLRCGPVGQQGNGGHAHNDQLAMELNVDGVDWLADPGSFVYTAMAERRDAYRSVLAHYAPRAGAREPGRLDLGMFRLGDEAQAECRRFDKAGFLGVHFGFGRPVFRAVEIGSGRIIVRDGAGQAPRPGGDGGERFVVGDRRALREIFGPTVPFSPGYGRVEK